MTGLLQNFKYCFKIQRIFSFHGLFEWNDTRITLSQKQLNPKPVLLRSPPLPPPLPKEQFAFASGLFGFGFRLVLFRFLVYEYYQSFSLFFSQNAIFFDKMSYFTRKKLLVEKVTRTSFFMHHNSSRETSHKLGGGRGVPPTVPKIKIF